MKRLKAAIVSSSDRHLQFLSTLAETAGFEAVTALAGEVGREAEAIGAFLRRHAPNVVIYDIAAPYPDNWALFCRLREQKVRYGYAYQFILTTPNKQVLEAHVGSTSAIELVGDDSEHEAIVHALADAIATQGRCC